MSAPNHNRRPAVGIGVGEGDCALPAGLDDMKQIKPTTATRNDDRVRVTNLFMKAQELVRADLSVLRRALFKADHAPVAPIGSSLHLQAMF